MTAIARQRGITFVGFITVAVLLAVAAIFGMRLIPVYMDNGKIQKAFEVIVQDPSMQTASVAEIRESFAKRAITMDNVSTITAEDIEISKDGGSLALSASYSKRIPLFGNISLLLEFNPAAPR